jgi:hypothetical protein
VLFGGTCRTANESRNAAACSLAFFKISLCSFVASTSAFAARPGPNDPDEAELVTDDTESTDCGSGDPVCGDNKSVMRGCSTS